MNFLEFFTNYKQDHRLQNAIKFDLLVWPTFEIISDFFMHNVYWDTLYNTYYQTIVANLIKRCVQPNYYGSTQRFLRKAISEKAGLR